MTFTMTGAIVATLVASFMFALWYQALKHLEEYPLAGFVMWLYISSYATVWIAVAALGKKDIPAGILAELAGKGWQALGVVVGGACMTLGLIISLIHMKDNGMIANQAIAGSVASIFGLILNFVVGGLAENVSLLMVVASAAVLLVASAIIQQSSVVKYAEKGVDITKAEIKNKVVSRIRC